MFKYNSIGSKPLLSLSHDEIAWLHLSDRSPETTQEYFVLSALREAELTMRHTNQNNHSQIFGPLLCAFAIWDQLGSSYADRRRTPYSGSGSNTNIKKALHYFGDVNFTATEIEHLYMLRNGIVHDASFTSHNIAKTSWFIFRFDNDLPGVIRTPTRPWNGMTSDISSATTTLINRDKVVDMTSHAIDTARALLLDDISNLDFVASQTEVLHKYLLWKKRPSQ